MRYNAIEKVIVSTFDFQCERNEEDHIQGMKRLRGHPYYDGIVMSYTADHQDLQYCNHEKYPVGGLRSVFHANFTGTWYILMIQGFYKTEKGRRVSDEAVSI